MNHPTNRSRRSWLKGAAIFAGGTLGGTLIPSERARAKTPKNTVSYQDKPNNGQRCMDCNFFQPPDSCTVVDGTISPDGWCKLFTAKTK